MLQKPFDNLQNVTKAIEMYKNGDSLLTVAAYFSCPHGLVSRTLSLHGVSIRPRRGWGEVKVNSPIRQEGKYDYLFFEPKAQGKDYKHYLKDQGLVVTTQSDGFTKIRQFDMSQLDMKKIDFVKRKPSVKKV